MTIDQDRRQEVLDDLAEEGRDLFFYSGLISRENVLRAHSLLEKARSRAHQKASLVLATYGGDPHEAYRLARFFRDAYETFRLVVHGPCKSAGTLVAVGADELAMGPHGELGPLDVQIAERDEIAKWGSGLDAIKALEALQAEAQASLSDCVKDLVLCFGDDVSTKTICDVAAGFVSSLFAPIAGRIDPERLATVARRMDIAETYGNQLGAPNVLHSEDGESALTHLIRGYPSHGYIIDRVEARTLFHTVDSPTKAESVPFLSHPEVVLDPDATRGSVICDMVSVLRSEEKGGGQDDGTDG